MTTDTIETYYKILDVKSNATVEEIKRAYKQKAKELHPDKNKRPDAHEQFILLTEAYECLIDIMSVKPSARQKATAYSDWQSESRERTRQHAKKYAKMEFEKFKQTEYYKNVQAARTVIEHLYFFSAIIIILCPLWGYLYEDWAGFGAGLTFTFFTIHFWAGIFTKKTTLNFRAFFQSFILVVKTKTFNYGLIALFNLFALFSFTLNTQLTFYSFAIILLALYGLTYLVFQFKPAAIKQFSKVELFLLLTPSLFNLIFMTNFVFSSNPTTEVYSFVHEMRWYGGRNSRARLEKIAYIDLERNKYQEYNWFRVFFDFDAMKDKSEITYKFEDGLLGLRVLKDYEFTK